MDRANGSTQHPPWLDADTDYAAWKAKMRAFLWAQDEKVWSAVEPVGNIPPRKLLFQQKQVLEKKLPRQKI